MVVPVTEQPGDRIGRYRLEEKIGEGGSGVVYLADQEEPVQRRVALKTLKLGMNTRAVVGRFEAERQALALMDHPNIAKVLDAGATHTGRPYFVMEWIPGTRITEYCDRQKLPNRERLGLFLQVCAAIQHAHQKGIIHRDIKPSNILVTGRDGPATVGCPKVIDFGIAKALDRRLTDVTLVTGPDQWLGTPVCQDQVLKLRNEAIATMTLPDLRVNRQWPDNPAGIHRMCADATVELMAQFEPGAGWVVRRFDDHHELARLPGQGHSNCWTMVGFSPNGQLLACWAYGTGVAASVEVWDWRSRLAC